MFVVLVGPPLRTARTGIRNPPPREGKGPFTGTLLVRGYL
jgi:hypothetical protein